MGLLDARERAAEAKRREIDTHHRAVGLQEQAAAIFDQLNRPELADGARQRAAAARVRVAMASAEQGSAEREWRDRWAVLYPAKSLPGL